MITFKLSNTSKKTPYWIHKIGDGLLISIVALQPVINSSPIENTKKDWMIFIISVTAIALKFLTRLFHDDTDSTDQIESGG